MDDLAKLEKKLGLKFRNPELLIQALVHPSYLNENPDFTGENNQRLEYLGDALLDFLVGEFLFRRFSQLAEGELTSLRAALVKTKALAEFARQWDLGQYLFLGRGEEERGSRNRPSLLAVAFEALLGAVYLDQGIAPARRLVLKMIEPQMEKVLAQGLKDYKTTLQEQVQAIFHETPAYRLAEEKGPDHAKEFTVEVIVGGKVLGQGRGASKQEAEQEAAREALKSL